jgi:hypothetical protein
VYFIVVLEASEDFERRVPKDEMGKRPSFGLYIC